MRWQFPEPVQIPAELQHFVGGHALVSEMLVRQGISTPEAARPFLDFRHYQATDAFQMPGMEEAVAVVNQAITAGEGITVWGDFDVDGQTATTVLVSALSEMGADVDYTIPVRKRESHGISLGGLERVIKMGRRLLLTCDTGISEVESIAYAKAKGMKVVITDHHKLPQSLPATDAIVNPNFLNTENPLHPLPGVGVAYKFIEALASCRRAAVETEALLDLVSLGIVADLALLVGENRYLLQKGLIGLRRSERIGIQKLLEKAEILQKNIDEGLIGFQIAPRLNALGRLDDANMAVELFLTRDEGRAEILATQIEGLNQHRKMLTRQVSQAALEQVERDTDQRHAPILILHGSEWPGGILGLAASTLVNRYQKPTILLTGSGERIGGSARSIPGLDITDAISSQSALLSGFGGHSMAGGLSLPKENLAAFRAGILRYVHEHLEKVEIEPVLAVSAELNFAQISLGMVDDIGRLAPFGAGNPALTFVSRNLTLESHKVVGRNREHRQMSVVDEGGMGQKVIWWNGVEEPLPASRFDLAYQLSAGDFRGERQLTLTYVDAISTKAVEVLPEKVRVIDHRKAVNPSAELAAILAQNPAATVWAEGNLPAGFTTNNRLAVQESKELILWNIPPSWQDAQAILEKAGAKVIHIFAQPTRASTLQDLLIYAAGVLKAFVKQKNGAVTLFELATGTGCPVDLIHAVLNWINAKGLYSIKLTEKDQISIEIGSGSPEDDISNQVRELENSWAEFDSWQRFYQEGVAEAIIL